MYVLTCCAMAGAWSSMHRCLRKRGVLIYADVLLLCGTAGVNRARTCVHMLRPFAKSGRRFWEQTTFRCTLPCLLLFFFARCFNIYNMQGLWIYLAFACSGGLVSAPVAGAGLPCRLQSQKMKSYRRWRPGWCWMWLICVYLCTYGCIVAGFLQSNDVQQWRQLPGTKASALSLDILVAIFPPNLTS